ncbi:RHS repeat-associated core domain-containing protein [Burkholderia stagnalis]|uniref:RHS repeat-associated core domain-containing protein n=1 Tax=Burkholderia stagnalis TaxID=1503054 RepID=UPI000F59FE41|nr:RHS repeat-associated core domain-containing protein [Burkholderia stagnalis]RQQ91390.1 hypothetical protein DF031_33455 [Burkholderia stagnalis]
MAEGYISRTRLRNAHGNLIRKTEPGGVTWLYAYDVANRLKRADRYAKPPAANEVDRIERTQDGTTSIPGTVRPELRVSFAYDAFGRRTLKEVGRPDGSIDRTVFTWDGDVLLMEERFHLPPRQPGEREPLTYRPVRIVREDPDDDDALPVAQRMHTLSERHQWQGASLYLHEPGTFVPLARLDETLVEAAFIATGTDGRFVQVPAKTRHATLLYQNDHLGTPQELLDESGKVVWLGRYKAWGGEKTVWQAQPERHEAGNPIRFQGQYHDAETGLHYNRHRYYDPHSGRFISKDPIGLAGGINVYQYAPNPTGWVDPLGLSGFEPRVLTSGTVFRNASGTPDSLTPRLGKDTTRIDGREPGLSAAISEAGLDSGKYVELDVGKLCSCGLQATHDKPNGHVTIRPINDPTDSKLTHWAKSRGGGSTHSLTEGILRAITGRGGSDGDRYPILFVRLCGADKMCH